MEKIVRQTLLFDFYGDLLTAHQREIYEEVVCNDTSCSEVAEREGVSRQGIHELVHKCERQMDGYEEKLHLMERFLTIQSLVRQIRELAGAAGAALPETREGTQAAKDACAQIVELCRQVLEGL